MQKISFRAMNCDMMVAVDRGGSRVAQRLEQVPGWFAVWEQCLSRFRSDSELSQINMSAGRAIKTSSVMNEILNNALRAARVSEGIVTPTVLGALEAIGYDRSFDELSEKGMVKPVTRTDYSSRIPAAEEVEFNSRTRVLRLPRGVKLDLGGVVKGWAADRAAHRLRRLGPVFVNAGGDIAVTAPMADGEPWLIGVRDPFEPAKNTELLNLSHGGVATSGRDYRRWMSDKLWQHHIIDPRTGTPAQTDILTATVVGPSAQAAEIAAKIVLISGSYRGIEWLNNHSEFAGLVVLEDGEKIQSHRWLDYAWR